MVVSEKEDPLTHFTAANVFFSGYDLLIGFMILARIFAEKQPSFSKLEAPLLSAASEKSAPSCWKCVALVLFVLKLLSKMRFLLKLSRSVIAVLEWTDANSILAFLVLLPLLFPHEVEKFQYVIVRKKSNTMAPKLDLAAPAGSLSV